MTILAAHTLGLQGSMPLFSIHVGVTISPPYDSRMLQASAAARLAGRPDVFDAVESGDLDLVFDHIVAEPKCASHLCRGERY